MKHKLVWTVLAGLLFLGCAKKITIKEPMVVNEPRTISYEEPVKTYETTAPSYEEPYDREEPIATVSSVQDEPFNITPLEAFDKIQEDLEVLILDVRGADEIPQDGKISNSIMIPLPVLAQNLNRLDKSKTILVYCRSGNRSVTATKLLRSQGFSAINMLGGIKEWKRAHLNVVWK